MPTTYRLTSYGDMITCEPRTSAYASALRQAVKPGSTVMDIGAGSGIFSLLACQYGAARVIAIEPDSSVEVLQQTAAANGWLDRISIFQGLSTAFNAEVRADVIISDLRGILPLFEAHIEAIVDARERFLAPGGQLIPQQDRLYLAVANCPKAYRTCEEPWLRNSFDLDLTAGRRYAVNSISKVQLKPQNLLSKPHDLAVLDYRNINEGSMSATADLIVETAGRAHGLALWFDAELADGISFSNAPGQPELVYGQTFFPFEEPVKLAAGDRISAEIKANLVEGTYVWSWNSSIWRPGSAEPEMTFRQSTFLSQVISPKALHRIAENYVPPVAEAHEIDSFCLSRISGDRTLGQIAELVHAKYPTTFGSSKAALNHVAALVERYHRRRGSEG